MKIKAKLILGFIIIGLIPMTILTIISLNKIGKELETTSFQKLEAVRTIKAKQVEGFFQERYGDAKVFSELLFIENAITELDRLSKEANNNGFMGKQLLDYEPFKAGFDKYYPFVKSYMESYGYYDVFLISPNSGRIVVSVTLEPDFGTELKEGGWGNKNDHLSKAWRLAKSTQKFQITDFEPYAPSNNAPAMFIVHPAFKNGVYIGAIAFQISLDAINNIMQEQTGMGISGETYLVGPDKKMRSDSRIDPTDHSVTASFAGTVEKNGVDTEASKEALAGNTDAKIIMDYTGNPVFSAYSPVNILGMTWAIIAEINEDEAMAASNDLRSTLLVILSVIMLIVVFIALFFARSLNKGIQNVIDQIKDLIQDTVNGRLDSRGDPDSVIIDFKEIVEGINSVLDAVIKPLNVTAEYVDRISKGDMPPMITDEYRGDFNEIKNNLNLCIDSVTLLIQDANMLSTAAIAGQLDARAKVEKHSGDFRKIMEGFNGTLDAVINPLVVTAEYVDRISKGDMPPMITAEYRGDFNEIKNNLNLCIESVTALVNDTQELSENAMAGKLRFRGDATLHNGDFRKIIEGVNASFDSVVNMLDNLPTPIIAIDKDHNINYMNQFGANIDGRKGADVEGTKCHDYFKSGHCQTDKCVCKQAMLQDQVVSSEIDAHPGKHDMEISHAGIPIKNPAGTVIGAFEIIQDQTEITKTLQVNQANLTTNEQKAIINAKIAQYNADGTDIIVNAIKALSEGNMNVHTKLETPDDDTRESYDTLSQITNAIGDMANIVNSLIIETNSISTSCVNGELDTRAAVGKFSGEYRTLVSGINDILDAVIKPLNVTAEYVDRISKGDMPPLITDMYKGDFNAIKNNLNLCIESIGLLVEDANKLSDAAVQGNLEARADDKRHFGDFRKIIEGLNSTLDAMASPIDEAGSVLNDMANGDLTVSMKGQYAGKFADLSGDINKLGTSFSDMIGQVNSTVGTTADAAMNISSTAETLAAASQEMNSQADDVASAVEEMARTVTENAQGATRTSEMATENANIAREGGAVVQETVKKMGDIAKVVEETARNIENLGVSSQAIGEIVRVIDDIADQTNLLALNASIEAARAGEQGRGFAVVADEVRKLAEKTVEATKEIASQINGIQKETASAVEAMKQGTKEVEIGIKLADQAGIALDKVLASSNDVTAMISDIAAASEQQAATTEEISKNVLGISHATADSTHQVEAVAATSGELAELTAQLNALMSRFTINTNDSQKALAAGVSDW